MISLILLCFGVSMSSNYSTVQRLPICNYDPNNRVCRSRRDLQTLSCPLEPLTQIGNQTVEYLPGFNVNWGYRCAAFKKIVLTRLCHLNTWGSATYVDSTQETQDEVNNEAKLRSAITLVYDTPSCSYFTDNIATKTYRVIDVDDKVISAMALIQAGDDSSIVGNPRYTGASSQCSDIKFKNGLKFSNVLVDQDYWIDSDTGIAWRSPSPSSNSSVVWNSVNWTISADRDVLFRPISVQNKTARVLQSAPSSIVPQVARLISYTNLVKRSVDCLQLQALAFSWSWDLLRTGQTIDYNTNMFCQYQCTYLNVNRQRDGSYLTESGARLYWDYNISELVTGPTNYTNQTGSVCDKNTCCDNNGLCYLVVKDGDPILSMIVQTSAFPLNTSQPIAQKWIASITLNNLPIQNTTGSFGFTWVTYAVIVAAVLGGLILLCVCWKLRVPCLMYDLIPSRPSKTDPEVNVDRRVPLQEERSRAPSLANEPDVET